MTSRRHDRDRHRYERQNLPSVQNWRQPRGPLAKRLKDAVAVDCGWGRILFAHTFADPGRLVETMMEGERSERDIAFYVRDPHVVLSLAPHELFLDPSHTYRLWLDRYQPQPNPPKTFFVRRVVSRDDAEAIDALYGRRQMVQPGVDFLRGVRDSKAITYFVAQAGKDGPVVGAAMGLDHVEACNDPEGGCSLWCLVVDPQAEHPGVGEALTRYLAEHYQARGRRHLDLSVLHDNASAIHLYEKIGFVRVPVFAIKRKNDINEPLFIAPPPEASLNPYARIIVDEARRRGIGVEVLDSELNLFRLTLGGRSILCRESLSELTSAVAMTLCDNKRLTHRVLGQAGLNVPEQALAGEAEADHAFLARHGRVVVKPLRGEQGAGVSVDVREEASLDRAVEAARAHCDEVLIESYHEGLDLRVIVIGGEVVAAAVRRPAAIRASGEHTVRELIDKVSRRRMAATGGESRIPMDEETERCVREAGFGLDDMPPKGEEITVRRAANLHTGGTIHDVTAGLHPTLAEAARKAAQALHIPVVGLDFVVPSPEQADYVIIEANERPGLANHEPQPTAERFIDLLFPQSG
ncbi:MAG: N-acetylglutaminylglutamine synthetase [Gammaproteobacteria bacterium]|nr:N-acetylglutaminylglutamine synthetase [Gammaproteobacteria bacterium]